MRTLSSAPDTFINVLSRHPLQGNLIQQRETCEKPVARGGKEKENKHLLSARDVPNTYVTANYSHDKLKM